MVEAGKRAGRPGRRTRKHNVDLFSTCSGHRLELRGCRCNGAKRHGLVSHNERTAVVREVHVVLERILDAAHVCSTQNGRVKGRLRAVVDLVDLFRNVREEVAEGGRQSAAVHVQTLIRKRNGTCLKNAAGLQVDRGFRIEKPNSNQGLACFPVGTHLSLIGERACGRTGNVDGIALAKGIGTRSPGSVARAIKRTARDVQDGVVEEGVVRRRKRTARLVIGYVRTFGNGVQSHRDIVHNEGTRLRSKRLELVRSG